MRMRTEPPSAARCRTHLSCARGLSLQSRRFWNRSEKPGWQVVPHFSKGDPPVLAFHLSEYFHHDGGRSARRQKRCSEARQDPGCRQRLPAGLRVDEPSTSLAEAFRSLCACGIRRRPRLARRWAANWVKSLSEETSTESIEPAAMKQVHGIDDQRNVRCILPSGVGKLRLGDDGVLRRVSAQLFDREWEKSP